jgi:hypothetical protein
LAALERARAHLETALRGDEDWLAFRRAVGAGRLPHERALAGNPLFDSWVHLDQAIARLRAEVKGQEAGAAAPDDLTRIRGIDGALARHLAGRGITRYGQIAAWRAEDVREVAEALGLGRRISRENWIEQAALLERRRDAGEPVPAAGRARTDAPSIELHQVLEHIRSNAASGGDRAAADVAAVPSLPTPGPLAGAGMAGVVWAEPEKLEPLIAVESGAALDSVEGSLPEEASVTFVIRELAAVSCDVRPGEGPPPPPMEDAPQSRPGVENEEAEVSIVVRPAGGSPPRRGSGT